MSERRRPFFTVASLATYLSLSERTISDWIRKGVLPSYRIGGARRIDPADVDAYLAEHRREKTS
ncbi:MAG TPA: helix-turn-helix domain-containing protein [Solirubrobacteraceae bacterium]|jgi:excisionase family DNA binding protein|nr:helix-turn-helix domain-containing protein [Solirubrobacteraceae bacterium]